MNPLYYICGITPPNIAKARFNVLYGINIEKQDFDNPVANAYWYVDKTDEGYILRNCDCQSNIARILTQYGIQYAATNLRANQGQPFYYIDQTWTTMKTTEAYTPFHKQLFEVGNYFLTCEEALEAAEKIRNTFKS